MAREANRYVADLVGPARWLPTETLRTRSCRRRQLRGDSSLTVTYSEGRGRRRSAVTEASVFCRRLHLRLHPAGSDTECLAALTDFLACLQVVADRGLEEDEGFWVGWSSRGSSRAAMIILGLGTRQIVAWSRVPRKRTLAPFFLTTQQGSWLQ